LGGTGVTDFAVFCGVRAATGVALFATAGASGTEADGSAEPDGSSLARARTGCAAACGVRMAKFVSGVSLAWSAIFPLGAGSSAGCGGTLLHSGTVWTDFACELWTAAGGTAFGAGPRREHAPHGRRGLGVIVGLFEEFAHFAPALAHQPHHNHLGVAVARHHADQRAFAHARSAEDAHPLAAPHAQHAVDGANVLAYIT
jgi:hypothetical protein